MCFNELVHKLSSFLIDIRIKSEHKQSSWLKETIDRNGKVENGYEKSQNS